MQHMRRVQLLILLENGFFDVFDRVIPKALTTGAKILSDECFKQANEIRASYMDYYLLDMPEKVDSTVV
jgi:regulator of sigma D